MKSLYKYVSLFLFVGICAYFIPPSVVNSSEVAYLGKLEDPRENYMVTITLSKNCYDKVVSVEYPAELVEIENELDGQLRNFPLVKVHRKEDKYVPTIVYNFKCVASLAYNKKPDNKN